MSLTKKLLTVLCIIKWICQESEENVIGDADNNKRKYSTDLRNRRSKLKGENYLRKCHQWLHQQKSKINSLSKGRRYKLKGKTLPEKKMLCNGPERWRKTPFTKACGNTTPHLESVLFPGERLGDKATCLSTCESSSDPNPKVTHFLMYVSKWRT